MKQINDNTIFHNLPWHSLTTKEVLKVIGTDKNTGLSSDDHERRLKEFGQNTFDKRKQFRFLKILFSQIKNPLIFILIVAGVLTLFLNEYTDAIVIFIAVAINTFIGVYQEGRASLAFEKLRSSVKRHAVVIRDGQQQRIEALSLVPGDIVVLQAGDQIPADIRIIETKGIEINESILTGEWMPVAKNTNVVDKKKRITEQANMAWMGTVVDDGYAKGIVVGTGTHTEFGKIAESLKNGESLTPFQTGVKKLARIIGVVVFIVIALIFIIGLLGGQTFTEMFLISVALAVAAIPEGLPIAVTVILAMSMGRILKKGGLVKRLVDTETLGSTTIIITDKTGTLTQAKMKVAQTVTPEEAFEKDFPKDLNKELLKIGVFASGAFVENPNDDITEWNIEGSPTERALVECCATEGVHPEILFEKQNRIDFLPFDAEKRFSASLNEIVEKNHFPLNVGDHIIHILGAPETMISLSKKWADNSFNSHILNDSKKKELKKVSSDLAKKGMRVLAVGYQKYSGEVLERKNTAKSFDNLVFAGFIALRDPVREDVPSSIALAQSAGVRPIMVTGDNAHTALAVAKEVGLVHGGKVVEGQDLEDITEERLQKLLEDHNVFARILPYQKKEIVRVLQAQGEVVAMTGDGVNDAPALKSADIGIALNSGTDVAKEASGIVLLQDSFSVIVDAIKEGRIVISNFRKVITYLLSTGFSEVILIVSALLLGFPLPLLSVQILWANIIGEGFMSFAFAFEPGEKDIMKRRPQDMSPKKIITEEMRFMIFGIGFITSILLVLLMWYLTRQGFHIDRIRTILFGGLAMDSLLFIFALKSFTKQIWHINLLSNKYLVGAFLISTAFLLGALFIPVLQNLLHTVTPTLSDLGILLGLGVVNLALIEGAKWFFIQKQKST